MLLQVTPTEFNGMDPMLMDARAHLISAATWIPDQYHQWVKVDEFGVLQTKTS